MEENLNKIKIIPENIEDKKNAKQMETLLNYWLETEEGSRQFAEMMNYQFEKMITEQYLVSNLM